MGTQDHMAQRESVSASPPQRKPPASVAQRLRADYGPIVSRIGYEPQSCTAVSVHIAMHLMLIVASALFCALLLDVTPLVGWLVYVPVAFFIGTRFRALGNMIHEACHGMLVRGKHKNVLFGNILSVIDHTDLVDYTREHFAHHRHLGDPERDLDFVSRQKFGFGSRDGNFVWKHLIRPLLLIHLPTYVRPVFFSRNDSLAVRLGRFALIAGLLALAHFVIGWSHFALFYVVPYFVAYQVIRYWSDAVDHAQIIRAEDEFERSRNHVLPSELLNRLIFPRHDEYHLTHHLFPAVPTPFQPAVHRLLLADAEYSARRHRVFRD